MGVIQKIDLTAEQRHLVKSLLEKVLPNTTVWAFGSRVKFTSRPESDLDLVAFIQPEQKTKLSELREQFDESDLPFSVDVHDWNTLPENFKMNIKKEYTVIQENTPKFIPNRWKLSKLGEVADLQNGYAFKSSDFSDKGIPVIKIKNIISPRISIDDTQYYEGNIDDKLKQFIVKKGDILISMTGSHLNQIASAVGKVGKYQFDFPALLNQRVGKLYSKNSTVFDNDFLYYFISKFETQVDLVTSAAGSANQANISPTQIKNLELLIPPIKEQQSIASILSSIDGKIELNLLMNQTLEALAQAIFKEWFVNFNFPGFDGELADGLPKGWRTEPIDVSIEFLNGLALQKFPQQNELDYLPVIKIRELRQGITTSSDKAGSNIPKQYIINDGDILFSWSGSLDVVIWCEGKGALNQHLFKVSSKVFPKWMYYYWTKHFLPIYQSIAEGKATTMGHIQRRHLTESMINVPDDKILKLADEVLSPLLERIIQTKIQTKTLTQLRDSLLPKLMTGKIEVK